MNFQVTVCEHGINRALQSCRICDPWSEFRLTSTTDHPGLETAKDRQIVYWQQQWTSLQLQLEAIRALVNEQAEDEGLWFIAEAAAEAYLQQELRKLHAVIESDGGCPTNENGLAR